jgi:glycosyltransferase involved in cell wall biosynthesis
LQVVHVSTRDIVGGAARAAFRLHLGLRELGLASTMLVADKRSDETNVACYQPSSSLIERVKRRLRSDAQKRVWRSYASTRPMGLEPFNSDQSTFGEGLSAALFSHDIVNLHWIAGFGDYASFFADVPHRMPVVWTLHDMNPFAGGCHYDAGCQAYIGGCGSCPQLGSNTKHDLAYAIFQRKHRALSRIPVRNLRIVSPSRWLAQEARKSMLFQKFEVSVIPCGLDLETFQPRNKHAAREALGLELDAKVVLFVADQIGNSRKGLDLVLAALDSLGDRHGVQLLTVGNGKCMVPSNFYHSHIGQVNSDRILSTIYSAADVFVVPSRQEAFGQTAIEALACGTPVVGFRVGGIAETVTPGLTGLLAEPENVRELRDCIAKLLTDSSLRTEMAANCHRVAKEEYSLQLQAGRYLDLYQSLLSTRG